MYKDVWIQATKVPDGKVTVAGFPHFPLVKSAGHLKLGNMATMESRPPFECPSLWFNVERATGILQRILWSSLRSVMSLKQWSKIFLCLLNVLALPTLAKFIPSTLQIFFSLVRRQETVRNREVTTFTEASTQLYKAFRFPRHLFQGPRLQRALEKVEISTPAPHPLLIYTGGKWSNLVHIIW